MPQTAVQDANQIRFGSALLEAGPDVGSLVNLGALRNVHFWETFDVLEVLSDNAGTIEEKKTNEQCHLTADVLEFNLVNFNSLRGGMDTYGTVAAAPVAGHNEVIAAGLWNYDKFIPLPHQNGDGSKITPTSVTGATNGLLVLNTDYFIAKQGGIWGIVVIDSATVTTENQNLTIVYTYTPAASRSLSTGGGTGTISPVVLRITNTDADGNDLQILVYKARNAKGIDLTFPTDQSGEPMPVPIELNGKKDTSRSAKDQLFKITDSQGV